VNVTNNVKLTGVDDTDQRLLRQRSRGYGKCRRRFDVMKTNQVIRLLETLLHPAAFAPDWTTRELHTRVVSRHQPGDSDYRLSQLRYDLAKLRAKGLVERVGASRRYRPTRLGLKLGVLLVKLRTRLLGPLASRIAKPTANPVPHQSNSVGAAFREDDTALDHLSAALALQHAA